MDFIITLLTDPRILSILSLPTVCIAVLAFMLYRLFQKYDRLQEQRLKECRDIVEHYTSLVQDINKTLDTVLRVIGKNGTNGDAK